jgi:hypothetical protein
MFCAREDENQADGPAIASLEAMLARYDKVEWNLGRHEPIDLRQIHFIDRPRSSLTWSNGVSVY